MDATDLEFVIENRLTILYEIYNKQLAVRSQIINIEKKLFARFWCYRV